MKLYIKPRRKNATRGLKALIGNSSIADWLTAKSKKVVYGGAALLLTLASCEKQYDQLASPSGEPQSEEARFSSNLPLTSSPSPSVFFMDKGDVYSITNVGIAKPTVTKKYTINDDDVYEHFNNNFNHSSNTLAYDFKTNAIVSLDYNQNDNDIPYLFKASTTKNLVSEVKTTAQTIGGGMSHVRINPANGQVFYVAGGAIWKMDANGLNNQLLVDKPGQVHAIDIDIDFAQQVIYFINFTFDHNTNKLIYSLKVCGMNGQNLKVLIADLFGEKAVGGQVRLDSKKNKVYFSTKSETKKAYHIWSISTSGAMNTLKKELEKPYADGTGVDDLNKFTFDILPAVNKLIWCLHERFTGKNHSGDESKVGQLNLATGVSDILYNGKDVNCIIAVNP